MDVTSALPDSVWLEDGNGVVFQQTVKYEWKPPYCASYNSIGHDCAKKRKVMPKAPQVKQVWVPKQVAQPKEPEVVVIDPVSEPEVQPSSDPAATPIHRVTIGKASTDEHGWKLVTIKSREGHKVPVDMPSSSNSFHTR